MSEISIILAAYNSEKYISDTINSIINQSFKDWELIVVDDGSIDNTKNIITKHLVDTRIKYIYQENQGQAKARNAAYTLSIGEYIAIIDHDDLWEDKKLEMQLALIKSNNEIGLVYTGMKHIDINGKVLNRKYNYDVSKNPLYYQLIGNNIAFSSMLIRRSAIKGNLHDERYPHNGDLYLTIKLALDNWKFGFIDETLLYYRISEGALSHNVKGLYKFFNEQILFYNDILLKNDFNNKNDLLKLFLANTYMAYGRGLIHYNAINEFKKARKLIIKAMMMYKSPKLILSGIKGLIRSYKIRRQNQ